ncbi:ABC transporter ATP-binding protein [Nitrincola tapanii]|uniref:ABC transporter ATP-binding protein n=1 Tax=Nitrincola tapanii TaxID=1708751 RepID=A0A5A9W6P2_9GAMM|nr:ABC transporter ATP-binding protein [Nitrincola tapanii]KAA0875689.1 ABC transporter ATP-binding protein [Nitrincola tapanii]
MTQALQIDNLRKTYANGFEALKGISLRVEQGDFFALLGPNGAGKSTTLGIVSSLVNPTAGEVKIFGYDLAQQVTEAKLQLGVVPQEFNFNAFEKVEDILITQAGYYGLKRAEAKARSEVYLKKLGLWDKREQPARRLSGGMKRRLMIARALVHQPKLLILDEPTAGVDIELRRSMWEFLCELNAQGTTIILTTHYLEEAESLCRNIAIIDQGEIIENTSMKRLLAQLNTETFLLDLNQELTQLPNLPDYRASLIDPHCLQVEVAKQQGLNELFAQLSQQGVQVVSMRNKANRLEELFVSLVEKNLQSGGRVA